MKKEVLGLFIALMFISVVRGQNDSVINAADTFNQKVDTFRLLPVAEKGIDQEVYRFKKGLDIPLTVTGIAWSLYGFTKIYNKDTSTTAQIMELDKNNISSFNRKAIDNYSQSAFNASNLFFYAAMPLPMVLMFDKKIRQDGVKVLTLYLEAMGITGILYTTAAYVHDKYRPYAYNPDVPMDVRKRGGAKNSFYAGHVALVGTSTFFIAKVVSDYHPDSKIKWLLYTVAAAATATTGYLRYQAGQHFPTDIFLGVGLGTLSGILVPHIHKNRLIKNPALSIEPYIGTSKGFHIAYRF
jgi:membrane-associated phospholipid phosphatase